MNQYNKLTMKLTDDRINRQPMVMLSLTHELKISKTMIFRTIVLDGSIISPSWMLSSRIKCISMNLILSTKLSAFYFDSAPPLFWVATTIRCITKLISMHSLVLFTVSGNRNISKYSIIPEGLKKTFCLWLVICFCQTCNFMNRYELPLWNYFT